MSILSEWGVQDHSGVVRRFDSETTPQAEFFWDLFRNWGSYRPVPGDMASWDELTFKRHLAPVTGADGSYKNVQPVAKARRSSTMAAVKLKKRIPGSDLFRMRAPGEEMANARVLVANEIADLWILVRALRNWLCAQTLLGNLIVSAVTVPGTDLPFTIAYATNNQSSASDWSGGAPTVLADLDTLQASHISSAGSAAEIAITNDQVQSYLRNDAGIQELLSFKYAGEALQDSPVNPAVFKSAQVAGLEWLVSHYGYVPEGGAFTRYLEASGDADRLVLLGARPTLRNVLRLFEGTLTKPSGGGAGFGATEMDMAGLVQTQPGAYGFSKIAPEGEGLDVFVGWVGLPVLTDPAAVSVVNVTP